MKPLRLIMEMFQLQRKSIFQTPYCRLLLFSLLSLSMNAKLTESLTVSEIYITTPSPIATTRPHTLFSSMTIPPFRYLPLTPAKNSNNNNNNQFHNSSVTYSTSASSSSLSSSRSSSGKIKFVNVPPTESESNTSANAKTNVSDLRTKRQLFREDIPHHRPLDGNHYAHIHGFPLPGRFSNNPNDPKSGVNNQAVEDDGGISNQLTQLTGHDNGIDNGNGNDNEGYDPNVIVHNHHHQLAPIHVNHGGGGGGGGGGETSVHNPGHGHGHGTGPSPGTTTTEFKNEIIHQYPVEVSQYLQLDHDIKSVHPHSHTSSALEEVPAPVFPQSHSNPHQNPAELDVTIPLYNEAIHGPDPDEPTLGKEPGVDDLSPHGNPQSYAHQHSYGSIPYTYSHQHQQQYPHHLHLHPHFHRRPSKFLHLLKTWPLILQKTMRNRHRRPIWPLFRATSFRTKVKHPHPHPPHYYAKYPLA